MIYRFGHCQLDTDRLELRRRDDQVAVEPQVFSLVLYLLENRERVVGKEGLIDTVWKGRIVSDATLSSRINAARRAVGDNGKEQHVIRTAPRRGFRFIAEVTETTATDSRYDGSAVAVNKPTLPDKPSIAVLAFDNLSDDRDQEYFADGIAEDLITALCTYRWLFAIARNSSFAYKGAAVDVKRVGEELGVRFVLEGSVRRAGTRVRVSAQLIDARSANHVWANRYDRDVADIFDLQDDIATSIAGELAPELAAAEEVRALQRSAEDLPAWDLFLRGVWHLWHIDRTDFSQCRLWLERSIDAQPRFAPALAALSWACVMEAVVRWSEPFDPATRVAEAVALGRRAVAADKRDANAYNALGRALSMVGEDDEAIIAIEQAIALSPSYALAHYGLGIVLMHALKPREAIERLDYAIRLSPHDSAAWVFRLRMGTAWMQLGEHARARQAATGGAGAAGPALPVDSAGRRARAPRAPS